MSFENKYYGSHEVEKALKEVDFEVQLPSYMPEGVSRQGAAIYTTNGRSSINIRYVYDKIGFYDLTAMHLVEPIESVIEKDSGFSWEEIQINGKRALKGISEIPADLTDKRIFFKTDKNIYYEVYSPTLDIEEMIKILESI